MKTKLSVINYEVKIFPKRLVEGKIKVRGGRPELANPVSATYYSIQKGYIITGIWCCLPSNMQ